MFGIHRRCYTLLCRPCGKAVCDDCLRRNASGEILCLSCEASKGLVRRYMTSEFYQVARTLMLVRERLKREQRALGVQLDRSIWEKMIIYVRNGAV